MNPEAKLTLEYEKSYIKNKKLVLVYNINIFSLEEIDFNKVNLEGKLKKYFKNEKYINLVSHTKKIATYEFDPLKWMKDTMSNTITNTPDRFEKKIKLGKLPEQVLTYANLVELDQIINGTFRNYLDKNAKLKKILLNSVNCVNKPLLSYFQYRYDGYNNAIQITLKSEFRTNPLLLIKEETKKYKIDFDKTVYTLLKVHK